MSSSSHNDRQDGFRRIIRKFYENTLENRSALLEPNPSIEARQQALKSIAMYQMVLKNHAKDSSLDEPWNERVPFDASKYLQKTVEVEKSVSWSRYGTETVEVPAVAELPANVILNLAKELDAIASELGFAASVKQDREVYHIASPDDDHPEPVSDDVKKPGE